MSGVRHEFTALDVYAYDRWRHRQLRDALAGKLAKFGHPLDVGDSATEDMDWISKWKDESVEVEQSR